MARFTHERISIAQYMKEIREPDLLTREEENALAQRWVETRDDRAAAELVGRNLRFVVKTFLDPSVDTSGIDFDPALEVDSVTDIWPGAEWPEREVYDMFGIRFKNHPDLRRILTWRDFPAHPLRKDYPLRGRGEREHYRTLDRESR